MTENWKPVVGWEDLYEVSDHGRVKSLERVVPRSNGRDQKVRERVLSPAANHDGYHQMNLHRNGARQPHRVHVLVAEAFLGPRPEGMHVLHTDDDPANNHLSNLSFGSHAENMRQRDERGRNGYAKKIHCPKGHPYSGDNLYVYPSGGRACRKCRRDQGRERMARQRKAK